MDIRHDIRTGQEALYAKRRREVRAPAPHEGVGNALRSAYCEDQPTLPEDMKALLARLR